MSRHRSTCGAVATFGALVVCVHVARAQPAPDAAPPAVEAPKPTSPPVEPPPKEEAPPPVAPPLKPDDKAKPKFEFALNGLTSTTFYYQNAAFGVGFGQSALFVAGQYKDDKHVFGADVRQTRLTFSVKGPPVLHGATPKALAEIDFLGSGEVATTGVLSDVSILPRLRISYLELKWARSSVQVGQNHLLTIGNTIPVSLAHISLPPSFGAGTAGWRQPGVFAYHTLGGDMKIELAGAIVRAGWSNAPAAIPMDNLNSGTTTGLPAVEARVKATFNPNWYAWVAGHWQRADRNGAGMPAVDDEYTNIQTAVGTVGFRGTAGPLAVAGSAWYGTNAGPLLGNIIQFAPPTYHDDIHGFGFWGQVGVTFAPPNWSAWGFVGADRPDEDDIEAAGLPRKRNTSFIGMLRYQEGALAIGIEWLYARTKLTTVSDIRTGNQVALTTNYVF